ncbi:MAG: metallophosphoesterase [Candidatus Thermoplasmatota archaeon]|nr:metallophosphoesterase [Candidatus Thermoplasmatota archaeon]
MKKITIFLLIFLFILPTSSIVISKENRSIRKTSFVTPGEIIAVSCSEAYPTVGQPVHLLITVQGKAPERFNQTLTITDEFSGFVMTDGDMKWISGMMTVSQTSLTIGKMPRYMRKIPWYPSVVGNHTLHVSAAVGAEKELNISVSFDVEGIITPALGCPAVIIKNTSDQLSVTLSEERVITEESCQILQLQFDDIHSASSYVLFNSTETVRTSVNAEKEVVEDDLILTYDTSSIPEGFYNLSVRTAKQNYSWPHAVKFLDAEPSKYTIVQLSDVHIGKYSNFVNKKNELIRLLTYLNEQIHPDFVILSGDSVDWYNQKCKRNVYADLQEALLTSEAPVYTIPGNHERYGNSLFFLYFPFTNLTPYHRFLNPLSDYSFRYGHVNYVFLDSGHDFSRWEIQPKIWLQSPEGSGLSAMQIHLLKTIWGQNQTNQIIIMHHPAVSNENDSGWGAISNDLPSGNNECIGVNRAAFITYCIKNNVSLVLTGHTHENLVLNSLGKEPSNPSAWPVFIQTDSATMSRQNNGGRVVRINQGAVESYEYEAFL